MGLNFSTPDTLFKLNHLIIIGWVALILVPFHKVSKYLTLLPALILSIEYTLILFSRDTTSLRLNFSHLSAWKTSFNDVFMIISARNHFSVMDLWVARWMVYDFYTGYTFAYNGTNKSWTFGRVLLTIVLLITYLVAPFGFLIYNLMKYSFLKKYRTEDRIVIKRGQGFLGNFHTQKRLFSPQIVRFADKLPEPLRTVYYFVLGLVGLSILFTIVLPSYLVLIIYCRIVYRTHLTSTSKSLPSKKVPEFVRNVTATMRLSLISTPLDKRNRIWRLKFLLLQFSTFIEYIVNSSQPAYLFKALEDYFRQVYNSPYYVLGNGIAVNSHQLVKRYLQEIRPRKDYELLAWEVSQSLITFSNFTTIFLSTDDPDVKLGRTIVFQWLHAFPHNLQNGNFETNSQLARILPRQMNEKPTADVVYQSVGEVLFFLATGGELTKDERAAFIEGVKNPMIFFPNWFNFLLNGHSLERKNLRSYYALLQAFARYENGPALQAAFAAAEKKKSHEEVLKFLTVVFCIAGSPAPAKLAVTVIDRLWADKEKNVRLFKKNPHNFIKECARLDKVVPTVNVLATDEIAAEIGNSFQSQDIKIPENTPIHCSLVNANRDETVFQNPDEFLPDRPDLNKIIVWNGVEEDVTNPDKSKRPIRYCPGHDLAIDVTQFVAERFLPIIDDADDEQEQKKTDTIESASHDKEEQQKDNNEKDMVLFDRKTRQLNEMEKKRCWKTLDTYTKLVYLLMKTAVSESNQSPSRAIDIRPPLNFPVEKLGIFRIDMAKFIPSWDEDEPNGSGLSRKLARWLVNSTLWDFYDCLAEFDTLEQAFAWRARVFPELPLPNVVYTDMFSDEAVSRLAFFGCACHYTQRIGNGWKPGCGIPEQKLLTNAVYVNDMTGLSIFRVRKPFERYGAAVYFDKDFQLIAIYWCHANRLIEKNDQFWEHAKYVWRSSFFAYVTICDHLIVTHMIECNAFVTATRKCLPSDHPLRVFLKPFTYHTVSVNYQAAVSLVNRRGLVHRIWAFDYDEFLKVCDYISANYKFRLLPEFISPTMSPKNNHVSREEWDKAYPIYSDTKEFWRIIQQYVANFFHITYHLRVEIDPDDDNDEKRVDKDVCDDKLPVDSYMMDFIDDLCKQLGIPGITSLKRFVDVLSQLIADSTGIHEHVGQISDYMIDPRFIGAKLQEGREMQNIQTYTQILILTVVTGLRMPGIMEDWSHLIEHNQDYEKNLKNYQDFKSQLRKLSKRVDESNKTRRYPFQSFNPRFIECSTSV
ncbi:unnamed protein product [Adineta ricciae]|uniref:Lipoxygenase domain-containing protein n=2 Tax=Adineta ricciae TaxID=249248 RepID=A0A815NTW1_ADIRI|nr:unnamed protein product [Adineta ricciae]